MKISKFCCEVELSNAVKTLAMYGMVKSVLGVVGAIFFFFFAIPSISKSLVGPDISLRIGGLYGGAAIFLLVNIGLFGFSLILLKRNKNNYTIGVKQMIKLGSYIIGSIEALLFSGFPIFGIVLISVINIPIPGVIMTFVGMFLLLFPCLLLAGIRTKNTKKIHSWIIFKFVFFCIIVSAAVPGLMYTGSTSLISIVAYLPNFVYSVGMVIVHYNIIIEDEKIAETVMNNITTTETENGEKKQNLEFSNPMSENEIPPPYSEVV